MHILSRKQGWRSNHPLNYRGEEPRSFSRRSGDLPKAHGTSRDGGSCRLPGLVVCTLSPSTPDPNGGPPEVTGATDRRSPGCARARGSPKRPSPTRGFLAASRPDRPTGQRGGRCARQSAGQRARGSTALRWKPRNPSANASVCRRPRGAPTSRRNPAACLGPEVGSHGPSVREGPTSCTEKTTSWLGQPVPGPQLLQAPPRPPPSFPADGTGSNPGGRGGRRQRSETERQLGGPHRPAPGDRVFPSLLRRRGAAPPACPLRAPPRGRRARGEGNLAEETAGRAARPARSIDGR